MSKKIVILFHSGYGHTAKVAQAVAEGSGGALLAVDAEGNLPEGGWEQLAAADAIVFGSPTYMGSVSWQFKKMADASSKVWFTQGWKNKLAAGFTNSASLYGDKGATLQYLSTLATIPELQSSLRQTQNALGVLLARGADCAATNRATRR